MAKQGKRHGPSVDCDAVALGLHGGTVKPLLDTVSPHAQDQAANLAQWLSTAGGRCHRKYEALLRAGSMKYL